MNKDIWEVVLPKINNNKRINRKLGIYEQIHKVKPYTSFDLSLTDSFRCWEYLQAEKSYNETIKWFDPVHDLVKDYNNSEFFEMLTSKLKERNGNI